MLARMHILYSLPFGTGTILRVPILKEHLGHLDNHPSRGAQAGDTWEGRSRILAAGRALDELRRYIPSCQRERRTRIMLSRATCPPCTCPSKLSRLCLLRDARRATESARHGSCPRGSTCSPGTWQSRPYCLCKSLENEARDEYLAHRGSRDQYPRLSRGNSEVA